MEWFEKSQDVKMILKSSLNFQIESLSYYRIVLFKYLHYYYLKHFNDIKDSLENLIKDLASVVSLEFGMQKRNEDSKKSQEIEEFKSFCKDFNLKEFPKIHNLSKYNSYIINGMVSNIQTFIKTTFLSKLKNLFIPLINKIEFIKEESKNLKIQKKFSYEVGQKLKLLLGDEGIDSFEVYLNSFKNLEISILNESFIDENYSFEIISNLFKKFKITSKLDDNYFKNNFHLIMSNFIQMNQNGEFFKNFILFPQSSIQNSFFRIDKAIFEATLKKNESQERRQDSKNPKKQKLETPKIIEKPKIVPILSKIDQTPKILSFEEFKEDPKLQEILMNLMNSKKEIYQKESNLNKEKEKFDNI